MITHFHFGSSLSHCSLTKLTFNKNIWVDLPHCPLHCSVFTQTVWPWHYEASYYHVLGLERKPKTLSILSDHRGLPLTVLKLLSVSQSAISSSSVLSVVSGSDILTEEPPKPMSSEPCRSQAMVSIEATLTTWSIGKDRWGKGRGGGHFQTTVTYLQYEKIVNNFNFFSDCIITLISYCWCYIVRPAQLELGRGFSRVCGKFWVWQNTGQNVMVTWCNLSLQIKMSRSVI